MPSNVSVEYDLAREKYEEAATPETKLACLIEMQRFAPAHKGGEKLRKHLSQKIAALRREIDKRKLQEKKGAGGKSVSVPKEGLGQVVLVGGPNSGKSTLLKAITGVEVEIAPYRFSTTEPVIGMFDYHGGKIQLVEIPAIVEGSSSGKFNGPQLLAIIRNADAVVLVAQSKNDGEILLNELKLSGILLNKTKPNIKIATGNYKGVSIVGKQFLKCPEKELVDYLKSVGVNNTSVILNEPTTLETMSRALNESLVYKKAIILDPHTCLEGDLDKIRERIFELLDIVLVYTKKPGREVEYSTPLSLPHGTTVEDAAKSLHKDFTKMKYAKLWGSSKYEGQRVPKDYVLKNFDVLEIYS